MSELEFHLLPWERGGHEITPSFTMSATVEGRLRPFLVKTRAGNVYFCFADEESDDRVWTLLAPEPEYDLIQFFQHEVEANHVARFFCIERGFSTRTVGQEFSAELGERFHSSNWNLLGPTSLAVSVDAGGRGFAQEWCGGPWFKFQLPDRVLDARAKAPSIWHRGWNVAGLRRALAPLAGEFAFRPFEIESESRSKKESHFICGSRAELEALYHAACIYFMPEFVKRSENDRRYWYYPQISSSTVHCALHINAETQAKSISYNDWPSVVPPALLQLLLAHHRPVGGRWHAARRPHPDTIFKEQYFDEEERVPENELADDVTENTSRESVLRVDFNFEPVWLSLNEQIGIARAPSAHERMEALLTLREWLESIGEGAQISKLLSL